MVFCGQRHAWFAHFYVVGIAYNAFVLAHALAVEPISAEHAAATLASMPLFQAHVARRFPGDGVRREELLVASACLAGYLVGVFYYVAAPVTLATPETRPRAVCGRSRRRSPKGARGAARAGSPRRRDGDARFPRRRARLVLSVAAAFIHPDRGIGSVLAGTARSVSSALPTRPPRPCPLRASRASPRARAFALGSAS